MGNIPTKAKKQPSTNHYICSKCSGTGFFCLAVVNGWPYSRTGFTCYKCGGAGWIESKRPVRFFRTEAFDYLKDSKCFVAEISELDIDAVPSQIVIESPKGARVSYRFAERDMSGDEVAGWNFVPTREALRDVPSSRGTSVLIIND